MKPELWHSGWPITRQQLVQCTAEGAAGIRKEKEHSKWNEDWQHATSHNVVMYEI
jgi:hypothetical protein